jgi:hypothetical protein
LEFSSSWVRAPGSNSVELAPGVTPRAVDAAQPADERTVVELAAGAFIAPFPDDNPLSPMSIGVGWKWPVRGRVDGTLTSILIVEWSFGV